MSLDRRYSLSIWSNMSSASLAASLTSLSIWSSSSPLTVFSVSFSFSRRPPSLWLLKKPRTWREANLSTNLSTMVDFCRKGEGGNTWEKKRSERVIMWERMIIMVSLFAVNFFFFLSDFWKKWILKKYFLMFCSVMKNELENTFQYLVMLWKIIY